MDDVELREGIIDYLQANRTTGAAGAPLKLSDANLVDRLGCGVDELNTVLASLIEDGVVHGQRRTVLSTDVQMNWDCVRLKEDALPSPDPRDLD